MESLKIIREAGRTKQRNKIVLVLCFCGKKFTTVETLVLTGVTRSCGCFRRRAARINHLKHGEAANGRVTPEYRSWSAMWARCQNESATGYKRYGGRGIKVRRRWKDYSVFLRDMGRRPDLTYTLDRVNNDGDYTPLNCRWATKSQQRRNQSSKRR